MSFNKQFLSKKTLNSFIIKELLDNSSLSILVNYSGFSVDENLIFKKFLLKYKFKVKYIKNRPLVHYLKDTKYKSILGLFQGNSLIIYKKINDGSFVNQKVLKYLSDNDQIILIGVLFEGLFLSPKISNEFFNNFNGTKGLNFYSILQGSIFKIRNVYLKGKLTNLFFNLNKINFSN